VTVVMKVYVISKLGFREGGNDSQSRNATIPVEVRIRVFEDYLAEQSSS
jgi:hypothetical protein